MKRSFQNIEPNYKAIAKLSIDQQFVAAVPCQVWLPRHIYERPFLTFDSAEPEHQIIGKLSPKYDVNISMLDFKGEIHSSIQANDIFLEKFSIWPRGSHDSLLITFQGEPYRLIESQRVESNNVKDHVTMTILYLSDNLLLEPTTIFERYYTGNARVKKVRGHSDSVGPFKEVLFDNHWTAPH